MLPNSSEKLDIEKWWKHAAYNFHNHSGNKISVKEDQLHMHTKQSRKTNSMLHVNNEHVSSITHLPGDNYKPHSHNTPNQSLFCWCS